MLFFIFAKWIRPIIIILHKNYSLANSSLFRMKWIFDIRQSDKELFFLAPFSHKLSTQVHYCDRKNIRKFLLLLLFVDIVVIRASVTDRRFLRFLFIPLNTFWREKLSRVTCIRVRSQGVERNFLGEIWLREVYDFARIYAPRYVVRKIFASNARAPIKKKREPKPIEKRGTENHELFPPTFWFINPDGLFNRHNSIELKSMIK